MVHGARDAGYDVTGTDGSKISLPAGGMIRGELDGTKHENVATNFRNPYEIALNSFGEAFCSDNDNDGNFSVRICWDSRRRQLRLVQTAAGAEFPPGLLSARRGTFRGAQFPASCRAPSSPASVAPAACATTKEDAIPELEEHAAAIATPDRAKCGPIRMRKLAQVSRANRRRSSRAKTTTTSAPTIFCTCAGRSLNIADWYDAASAATHTTIPTKGASSA